MAKVKFLLTCNYIPDLGLRYDMGYEHHRPPKRVPPQKMHLRGAAAQINRWLSIFLEVTSANNRGMRIH